MDDWNKTALYTDDKLFMEGYYDLDLMGDADDQEMIKNGILNSNPNGHGIGFAVNA